MGKMMEYKGYHATVEYDSDDNIFVGKVHGLSDLLSFHGVSVTELENMFHQSIDNYLDICAKMGKKPEKEYGGVFNVRVSSDLHRLVAEKALLQGKTINAVVNDALENYLQSDERNGMYVLGLRIVPMKQDFIHRQDYKEDNEMVISEDNVRCQFYQ